MHHFLLHPLQQLLAALGIAAGASVQPCHLLHIKVRGLQFGQAQIKGGLRLPKTQLACDVVTVFGRLRRGFRD